MAQMKRKKVEINSTMSYKELERLLISSELTNELKQDIKKWLAIKQKQMDGNWKEFLSFYSVGKHNPVFDLAKAQLFREGSPMVFSKGVPPRHQLYFNIDDYGMGEILCEVIDRMKKIEGVYFSMQARPNYGKTIEEISEAIIAEKEGMLK